MHRDHQTQIVCVSVLKFEAVISEGALLVNLERCVFRAFGYIKILRVTRLVNKVLYLFIGVSRCSIRQGIIQKLSINLGITQAIYISHNINQAKIMSQRLYFLPSK